MKKDDTLLLVGLGALLWWVTRPKPSDADKIAQDYSARFKEEWNRK